MLELKSNTDEGRQCKHCGYKRISSDKGNRKNCPSCHTAYDTRKSKRQGSGTLRYLIHVLPKVKTENPCKANEAVRVKRLNELIKKTQA